MKYLHYVTDKEGNQLESIYSNSIEAKFSLQCLAEIENAIYKVWNRETNEIIII